MGPGCTDPQETSSQGLENAAVCSCNGTKIREVRAADRTGSLITAGEKAMLRAAQQIVLGLTQTSHNQHGVNSAAVSLPGRSCTQPR